MAAIFNASDSPQPNLGNRMQRVALLLSCNYIFQYIWFCGIGSSLVFPNLAGEGASRELCRFSFLLALLIKDKADMNLRKQNTKNLKCPAE